MDPKYLSFEYRSQLVVSQLKEISADIIMLQEVDNFTRFYREKFSEIGYTTYFEQKSTFKGEGLVIGFKSNRFKMLEVQRLDLDKGHQFENDPIFQKGAIAMIAKIQDIHNTKVLNIINTHFYWNPDQEYIKYNQMAAIIKFISISFKKDDLLLWGGDLNSTPRSNLIQYVLNKSAPNLLNVESKIDVKKILEIELDIYNTIEKFENKFRWRNPYNNYQKNSESGEFTFPTYTNYTIKFKDTIDHIFFIEGQVKPKKILKIPSPDNIYTKGIPNRYFPSDHFPIACIFEFLNITQVQRDLNDSLNQKLFQLRSFIEP